MKQFDPYDFISVIVPGSILAGLVVLEMPTFKEMIGMDGVNLGGLGLFVIAAFVLGHLVQSLGNIVEKINWLIGGWPSDRVRSLEQDLISSDQREQLRVKVSLMEGSDTELEKYTIADWKSVTARIAARVSKSENSNRIEYAKRNYGLFRGIVASLLISTGWYSLSSDREVGTLLVLGVVTLAAIVRMRRFGRIYARNLFHAFLDDAA
jgi:hypothetical protein